MQISLDTGDNEKHYEDVESVYVDNLKKPFRADTLGAFAFYGLVRNRFFVYHLLFLNKHR